MSTNYARAKYQEIYDVNTVSNKVSVIGIHTPVGAKPRQMLAGMFLQFRKYKYSGCSVVGTPAQRLGLNLAQISTQAGASSVNPKDVFNPALVRGCHGDNLSTALNTIYRGAFQSEGSALGKDDHTGSDAVVPNGLTWEQMYYRMLQDPSFKKFSLSSGIKLSGLHPMVYNLATNMQMQPLEGHTDVGQLYNADSKAVVDEEIGFKPSTCFRVAGDNVYHFPQFMTNRLQKLGWLDTRQYLGADGAPGYTTLPRILMACVVLPMAKSDSVVTSMRFVVTHYFEFKEFNTSLTLEGASEYYDWLTIQSKDAKLNDTLDVNSSLDNVEIVSDGVY